MSLEDLSLDSASFRRPVPKKLLSYSKLHRYHDYYKGNGFINKVLVWENFPEEEEVDMERLRRLEERYRKVQYSGECGLSQAGVLHSQGKKGRWRMAEKLKEDAPEPEHLTATSSVAQFERLNTQDICVPVWRFTYHHYGSADARAYGAVPSSTKQLIQRMTKCTVKSKDGQGRTVRGNLHSWTPTLPQSESKDTQLHVEYQIVDIKMNKKLHNSNLFKVYNSDWFLNYPPETEGHRLDLDVARDSRGHWKTGQRERVAERRDTEELEQEEDAEEEADDQEAFKPRGLTLADFMPSTTRTHHRHRSLSESWDFVSAE